MGTSIRPPQSESQDDLKYYEYDDEPERKVSETEDIADAIGRLIDQQPAYGTMINAEIMIQQGEEYVLGKVKQHALSPDGVVEGSYDEDPIRNLITYAVELPDGQLKEYSANVIVEGMLAQVDSEGYTLTPMDAIVDHERDDSAVSMEDKYVVTKRGQRRLQKTTSGWKFLVKWRGGSETWIKLCDLKESHPIEVAEFAKARGIDREPAFAWLVPFTLRKRDVIISALKKRLTKATQTYGIEVSATVCEA